MQAQEREVARLYGELWDEIPSIRSPEILSQFLSNVGLPPDWFRGKLCLDVGCGSGFAVWAIDELGGASHACDLEPESLHRVRQRLMGDLERVRLAAASALRLPFRSATFDFVHCNGVLHHTVDPRAGFQELVRVTRPGGTLFLSLYGRGGVYNATLSIGRALAPLLPKRVAGRALDAILGDRRVPRSFMPAKVSLLDNFYVPIRHSYREAEISRWFAEAGFPPGTVVRTATTIYDHRKPWNRLIHGDGYLQFRATKPMDGVGKPEGGA